MNLTIIHNNQYSYINVNLDYFYCSLKPTLKFIMNTPMLNLRYHTSIAKICIGQWEIHPTCIIFKTTLNFLYQFQVIISAITKLNHIQCWICSDKNDFVSDYLLFIKLTRRIYYGFNYITINSFLLIWIIKLTNF